MSGKITFKEIDSSVKALIDSKINTSSIKNDLTTGGASNVLSAEQGKALKALIDSLTSKVNGKADTSTVTSQLDGKINKSDIVDSLVGGTGKVLSADQGKALKGLIDSLTSKVNNKADTATVNSQLGGKINTSAIKNDLTSGGASNVLSAEQGVAIKALIDNLTERIDAVEGGVPGDVSELIASKVPKSDIVNDLTTGGATKVLSAEQGKTLKGLVDGKASKSELANKADTSQLASKIDSSAIIDDLITGGETKVLSAEQGKTLKGLVDGKASKSDLNSKINTSAIKNDLTSGGASNVLSAEQGKTLKGLIDSLTTKVNAKADTTAVTQSANGLMTAADKKKLDGIATGANKYTHPSTHAASMITEDSTHRFLTDNERALIQAWETFKTNGGNIGGPLLTNRVERVISSNTIEHGYGFGLAIKSADGSDKLEIVIGNNANKKGLYPVQRMYLGTPEFAFSELWAGDFLKNQNGYNTVGNGFIEQWGVVNITGQAANVWCIGWSIQYPKMFPNAIVSLDIQILGDGNSHDADLRVIPYLTENTNTFQYHCKVGANGTLKFRWRALGY